MKEKDTLSAHGEKRICESPIVNRELDYHDKLSRKHRYKEAVNMKSEYYK